jgi:hypothetical protein
MKTRNERRLEKKVAERAKKKFAGGLPKIKKFVFEGLSDGSITREDMVEMCNHFIGEHMCQDLALAFIKKEILLETTDEIAIDFLGDRYTVTKVEKAE